MREIIDNMFFWEARELSMEDFCNECFEAKDFIESILKLNYISIEKNQKVYSREIETLQKPYSFRCSISNILKEKVNFTKAINDKKQKRL